MVSLSLVAVLVLCLGWIQFDKIEGANILGVFTTSSKSHFIIHEALMRGLAARGHNVTIVSGFPPTTRETLPNYHEIFLDLGESAEMRNLLSEKLQNPGETSNNPLMLLPTMIAVTNKRSVDVLYHAKMQELLKSGQKFDMMVLGWFMNDFLLGIGAHFQCPIAVVITVHPIKQVRDMIGNPAGVSSVPFYTSHKPMTFWNRFIEFLVYTAEFILTNILNYFVFEPYYTEHFPPSVYPTYDEVKQNISLVMANTHFSQGKPRPNLPNMIEIGGIQIKDKPDPLPKELDEYMNKAREGVVLFSLGSNARVSEMSEQKRSHILNALARLEQSIIMKWETDDYPSELPANVLLQQWLPQNDILAHPNTKLFISHCGLSSVHEAKYHGVPILAMPVFAEQVNNAKFVADDGWGIIVSYQDVTETSLSAALSEILTNESFANVVKEKSLRYRDRPLSALDTAIYWIEYVIRHKGARHMRSDAANMNIVQKNSLDVIAFLFIVMVLIYKLLKFIWVSLFRRLYSVVRKAKIE